MEKDTGGQSHAEWIITAQEHLRSSVGTYCGFCTVDGKITNKEEKKKVAALV